MNDSMEEINGKFICIPNNGTCHSEKLVWIGCGATYVADLSNSEWADTTRHTRSTPSTSNGSASDTRIRSFPLNLQHRSIFSASLSPNPSSFSSPAPSRRNPLPTTITIPICMNMRKSSIIAASSAGNGLYAERQPLSRSKPTPLPSVVPVGIRLKQPPTRVELPIFPVSQPPETPNTHETSAHCFEVKFTAAEARNTWRLEIRNDQDRNLVGTSLDEHNAALFKQYDYDLSKLLPDFQDTTVAFGSEYRPIEDLRIILGKHPNFDFFESTVLSGMDYHFTCELTEDERMAELLAQMARENHSSATSDLNGLNGMTGKDVTTKGFSLNPTW
ncbi:hypothetical protein FRACYDRAFT_239343 [Fragilariopsis cylindrus CCMP1102]|uniref:Uncharacterized protein n=1 Tax=Fragilariopsis cylindrus CCMP1102 TaxID=635003 RepID=A0A1E7FF10_9STRA|nr:hypothetical protein FRACYDRAFT_239343 [Fragilariopsis cylindrus CCMP1102]|eukprot:OEU16750.1 hypothetical protein FRACYDRAFT_239343 [Fragilariopsis cylindrus CCMP1102]